MYAIIPAGGAGTRLWPLSRASHPKFLLDLMGSGRSLLQATVDRLEPLSDGVLIVTGGAHQEAVQEQVPGVETVVEPSPKNSMAAIALATAILHVRHGDVVVGSFAADHRITDDTAFAAAVTAAIDLAEQGLIVTLGITPTGPSSAYGYIQKGQAVRGADSGFTVESFTEKPDEVTAARFLATGNYAWNAGMFIMRSGVLLSAMASLHPQMHTAIMAIARAWDTDDRQDTLAEFWPQLPSIAIDHAIAEPMAREGAVATVDADMGWSDIGDYDALAELVASPPQISVHSDGAWVRSTKPVVVVGIDDAVVVETDDLILVTTREASQLVKQAVDALPDDSSAR